MESCATASTTTANFSASDTGGLCPAWLAMLLLAAVEVVMAAALFLTGEEGCGEPALTSTLGVTDAGRRRPPERSPLSAFVGPIKGIFNGGREKKF